MINVSTICLLCVSRDGSRPAHWVSGNPSNFPKKMSMHNVFAIIVFIIASPAGTNVRVFC